MITDTSGCFSGLPSGFGKEFLRKSINPAAQPERRNKMSSNFTTSFLTFVYRK